MCFDDNNSILLFAFLNWQYIVTMDTRLLNQKLVW